MKEKEGPGVSLVCRDNCAFYKEGVKEDMACRGFQIITRLFESIPGLETHVAQIQEKPFRNAHPHLLRTLLCTSCDFFVDGCDFTDPDYSGEAIPCGGYVVLDKLLSHRPSMAPGILKVLPSCDVPIRLSDRCHLKTLEELFLYDARSDELYALDEGGYACLKKCDGKHTLGEILPESAFLETCLEEDLLSLKHAEKPRTLFTRQSPIPSLRYLELQVTARCNLRCRHCYLGKAQPVDMPLALAVDIVTMFEDMQGLRVLISGGEPLMYPHLSALGDRLSEARVRRVLLTNGTFVQQKNVDQWGFFDEIQFSVDGLKKGHDTIRGKGSFDQTVRGMELAQQKGIDISVATMIHRANLSELETMADWIDALGVLEWNMDVPCMSGRLQDNAEIAVNPEEGAPFLKLARGGSYHGSEAPYACGYHLAMVTPEGDVLKCGFFPEHRLGSVQEGLETCWKRAVHLPLTELECATCTHLSECKGGCRFRAPHLHGKDPVMCALFNES